MTGGGGGSDPEEPEPPELRPESSADRRAPDPPGLPPAIGRIARPLLRGLDGLYLVFQSVLRGYGLVSPPGELPEEVGPDGTRFGVLERREGRWPGLRMPLPDGAFYRYRVESIFRRAAVWQVPGPLDQVRNQVRQGLEEAWPEFTEGRERGALVFELEGGGVRNLVKLVSRPPGQVVLSLGQKISRLRFHEAERTLAGGPSGRLGNGSGG